MCEKGKDTSKMHTFSLFCLKWTKVSICRVKIDRQCTLEPHNCYAARSFPDFSFSPLSHRFPPLHLSPTCPSFFISSCLSFSPFVFSNPDRRNFVFRTCEGQSEWVMYGGDGGWLADLICEIGKAKVKVEAKKIELGRAWVHWSQDVSDVRESARSVVSFLNIPTV